MTERQRLRERVDARIATALDRRLVDQLSLGRSGFQPAYVASVVLATIVHLIVLALLLGGVGLILLGANPVLRIAGVVPLLPVLLLARRRTRHDAAELRPDEAPVLTALIAEVADALDTAPPTFVGIDEQINAHAQRSGLRSRTLVLGAPLWVALSPQARVGLIAHELGHFAHRDVVHGRYVGAALATLSTWVDAARPEGGLSTLGHTPVVAVIASWPLRFLATGSLRLLEAANAAASRRAELRADTEEAAVAGTDAAIEGLRVVLVSDVIDRAVNRAAVDPRRPDIAEEIRLRVAALDERDHATAAREAGESSRVDRTHPPTLERIRLQQSLPPSSPSIVLSPERIAALDAELRPFLDASLRRRADWYR